MIFYASLTGKRYVEAVNSGMMKEFGENHQPSTGKLTNVFTQDLLEWDLEQGSETYRGSQLGDWDH